MSEEDFIIAVFCCVDDLLQSAPELLGVRRRGFAPRLCGSEAVTMEVVGEFLAMDSDKTVWGHFRRHWQCLFPGLGSRSVFVRQAANLWFVRQRLQAMLSRRLEGWGDTVPSPRVSPCQCATSQGPSGAGSSEGRPPTATAPPRGRSTTGCGGSGREPQRDRHRPHPHGGQCGREGRAPRSRRQHPGAAHRRQGLHPSPVEGRLRGRGIGLQTPLRKNMADERHPGFARMPVKARRMAKTVIAQPAQHFSLRAHTGAGPLAPHQPGRAKNARPYCSRLPQPVCRTAATPVRGTASTVKSRT